MDHTIAAAVRELIVETGYSGLTMDAVAARAGVGKAAIYRRHSSKASLVFASLLHGATPQPLPRTGTLRGDLTALAETIVGDIANPLAMAAAPGLMADLAEQPEVAELFRQTFFAGEQAEIEGILSRHGVTADAELLHAQMLGTAFAWLYLLRKPLTPGLPGHIVASALASLGQPEN
ncbi:TetR/AcrR family transcriptional regulator [Longispora albida]|uniref:TetR/AcrR family transcriptional regulator n=1 Tax=Longispora albida TaxID=203523 RepID=UPI00036D9FFF|nr:TetR/AcrR family transcriptional regulator [Longispora albida]